MEHSSVEGMMSMYFQKVAGAEVSMNPYLANTYNVVVVVVVFCFRVETHGKRKDVV